jgi:hypothetical protein
MAKTFIEYILDPVWVSGHCLDGLSISVVGGDSFLVSYEHNVALSCCAPNSYLYEHQELLKDKHDKCLLLELFHQTPSDQAMKLLDQSVISDASFASMVL